MTREKLILHIEELSERYPFEIASKKIEEEVYELTYDAYIEHLAIAGVIPEIYPHSSSTEKLYAKYLDSLLSRFFKEFNFQSEVIRARQGAPDVLVYSKQNQVILVGDAKGFRLSRTAKNQKDFKVKSLRSWADNYGATYACLLASLFQYPPVKSQIYSQAIESRVTLISYEDCIVLLENRDKIESQRLIELFSYSDIKQYERAYPRANGQTKEKIRELAKFYRGYIIQKICNISKIKPEDFAEKLEDIKALLRKETKRQLILIKERKYQLVDKINNLIQLLKAEQRLNEILEGKVNRGGN